MSTCSNCAHWQPLPRYIDGGPEERGNYCDYPGEGDATCDIVVVALDDSGLDVWLRTGPNFSCPNFTQGATPCR